jgi:outer membrane receptor for ferrienterochelin and colicins
MIAVSYGQTDDKPSTVSDIDLLTSDIGSLAQMKVVTASKFSQNIAKAPGVMTVVSKDELRRMNASTLYEILSTVVGFSVTSSEFQDHSMLAARGDQIMQTGGHILFLINGRPTREVLSGGIISDLLESFPVNVLERLEVIRGPGSVLYGSNAVAAVVHLITKPVAANSLSARASSGIGGATAASAEATLHHGPLSVLLGGQFLGTSAWNTGYLAQPIPFFGPQNAEVLDTAERRQSLLVDATWKGFHVQAAYFAVNSPWALAGYVGRFKTTRTFADVGYDFRVAGPWQSSVNFTYTGTTFESNNLFPLDRHGHEAQVEWSNSVTLTNHDTLAFGTLVRDTKGVGVELYGGQAVENTGGERPDGSAYLQWQHDFRDTLTLVGGVQANKIAGLAWNLSPRIGAIWTATPNLTAKALYSSAFRAPSIDENTIHDPSLIGDPNLLPERVQTVDAGVSYQSRHLLAGVNYFHTKLVDGIVLRTGTLPGTYLNIGRFSFQGVELESKYYLTKRWLISGSMIYQTSADANTPDRVSPAPAWSPKSGVSYRGESGLSFSVFDQFSSAPVQYAPTFNPSASAFHMLTADFRCPVRRMTSLSSSGGGRTAPVFFVHGYNLADHPIWLPVANGIDTIPFQRGRVVSFGVEFSVAGKSNR